MRFSCLVVLLFATTAFAGPPNIVLIIGDDQAWTDYGFLGHPQIKTPHLDKLASESLVFERGYVPTSLCRASLATMITGLYPHQHRITSNDPPLPRGTTPGNASKDEQWLKDRAEMVRIFEESPNLAKLLGEKGYVTHQSGKWWEGNACRCGGFMEGMTEGDPTKGGRHGDTGLTIGRQGLKPVLDFLDKAKKDGKPFFVWYAPMMPHTPHNPPARLFDKYKTTSKSEFVAKYWAMCEWFDETVGDLLNHLDDKKLAKDTIVIYLHDNGWIQDPKKGTYAAKSKRSPYDGGVRTPIIIRWPGKIKPRRSDELASSVDLAPTILQAAGIRTSKKMTGLDLLNEDSRKARTTIFGEIFEHNAVDIRVPAKNLQYRWVIDGRWKLIVPNTLRVPDGQIELYDTLEDPKEEKNLADKTPEKARELSKKLDDWWKGDESK